MTSRINIRQLRSHTDCAQRWKSGVIRLEECYKTKSGTYNDLVMKTSTFQMCPLKEGLLQSFADIRNTPPGAGMESCPKQGVTVQAHSADARATVPCSSSMLDPALELPLHLILDLGQSSHCRGDIHSQLSSPNVTAKLLFH